MVRFVLDTNVVVAGLRSPSGASAALLRAGRHQQVTLLGNVAMVLEYEAVCHLPEHREAAGVDAQDIEDFLNTLVGFLEPVESHFRWRPALPDPNDEMVLEAAVNGRADAIVTFNIRDFVDIPATFGIDVLTPAQAIRRVHT
jgi:putative PIN family toxin of toxin-antitoxin system